MTNPPSQYFVPTAAHQGSMLIETDDEIMSSSRGTLTTGMEDSLQSAVRGQVRSDTQVRFPVVRKGFLASLKNPQGIRGQDEFARMSWDETLKLIHHQYKRIREAYGPTSIFAGSYGQRSNGVLHKASTLLQRYMALASSYAGHLGDCSTSTVQTIMPYVVSGSKVYQQQTNWPLVLEYNDVVVLWSASPLNTLRIAWNVSDEQGLSYFSTLRDSGKKLACIDPMRSEAIDFFDGRMEWVAPYMNTDITLVLGIAHTLVEDGWHDGAFLVRCTAGYTIFASYLLGESDGAAKNTEWTTEIYGVSATKIRELTAIFYQNTTMLTAGQGMQRQQFGEQKHWMLVTLAAMLGQVGTPSGGFNLPYRLANDGSPTRHATVLSSMQGGLPGGCDAVDKIPVARIVEALESPGGAYQHNGMDRHFPDIRFIWWTDGVNFTHHRDTNRLVRVWQKPELVVISEYFWTAAAKHANVVLPATTSFKRNDLTMTGDYSNQRLVPMKQMASSHDEACNDFDVFADLSEHQQKGGYARFTERKGELQWLRTFYDVARQCETSQQAELSPFAKFWQANQLIEMPENPDGERFIRFADFRRDPQTHPLEAASGKIKIFSQRIAGYAYPDYPGHPAWLEPDEQQGSAEPEQLQMLSTYPAHRLRSQLNYNFLRELYVVTNREPVTIHPNDAQTRGIQGGDTARLWNSRGQVPARAITSEGIKPGVIYIHEGI